jgi:Phage integrase, N-terminal SAM-like domain
MLIMPNTVRAYAMGLRLWSEFLGQAGTGWADAGMEDVARFGLYEKCVAGR